MSVTIHRAGSKHLYIPGGSLGVRAYSAGEISAGGLVSTRSVQFDGVNDWINPGTAAALNQQGEMSISIWFRANGDYTSRQVLASSFRDGSIGNYIFMLGWTANKFSFWNNGQGPILTSMMSISDDTWRHYVVARSGTTGNWTLSIYIDGVVDNTSTETTFNPNGASNDQVAIGRLGALSDWYVKGLIDDPRIYNVALTPTDVGNLAAGQDVTAGLVAYWALEEGSGTNTVDAIGGNNGTLTGGPTWSTDVPAPLA